MKIQLDRMPNGEGFKVHCPGEFEATFDDIDWAGLFVLGLIETSGFELEVTYGVQGDPLEQGRKLREILRNAGLREVR